MYAVKSGGAVIAYSDTAVYIRLHDNGCYVPCDAAEAEGFCVKTAVDFTDEETGETMTRLEDFVYAFKEDGLLGIEPIGELETVSGALMVADMQAALEIMGVEPTEEG